MGFNTKIVIGMLIIALSFTAISSFLFSVGSNYDIDINNSSISENFEYYDDIRNLTDDTQRITEAGEINPVGQDQAVYSNVVVAGKQLRNSGNLLVNFINSVPTVLGISPVLITMIITLVLFLSTIAFITMISKRRP